MKINKIKALIAISWEKFSKRVVTLSLSNFDFFLRKICVDSKDIFYAGKAPDTLKRTSFVIYVSFLVHVARFIVDISRANGWWFKMVGTREVKALNQTKNERGNWLSNKLLYLRWCASEEPKRSILVSYPPNKVYSTLDYVGKTNFNLK